MTCATSTIKFLSLIFNILCCICGALSISASAYALATFTSSDAIFVPCIIGLVLGSLLFLATFIGCCGAIRESVRMTWVYAIVLLLLMLAQIGIIFTLSVDFNELAKETIENAWNRELHETSSMAYYETKYFCCGKIGSEDYIQSGLIIPESCYKNQNTTNTIDIFTVGCVTKLEEVFADGSRVEEISDWSLVGIEGATIIVACILAISLRNQKRRLRY